LNEEEERGRLPYQALVTLVLGEKMVHSTQLKEKIDTEFAKARERFKEIIEVYNQNCFA
jgi:hypothetical protein